VITVHTPWLDSGIRVLIMGTHSWWW